MSLNYNFGNYTYAQCYTIGDEEQQVACLAQHLNVTNPPSIYSYDHYEQLWLSTVCLLWNVSYSNRVLVHDDFTYCNVPLSAQDAFLFVGIALLVMSLFFGKLSAVWVLVAGGALSLINWKVNMYHLSNAITVWLNIQPPDLFFYAFLPPLLVDSAIRIDSFVLRKLTVHVILMAFVMVVLTAAVLTPLILFVLGFAGRGWSWVHGALFASMIAPTDALAAAAILKRGGGPERLVVLMEGEALLNDASAITLFEVFMHVLEEHITPFDPYPSVWSVLPGVILNTLRLAAVGAGIGLAMSWCTLHFLHWLRWRGARPQVEMTVLIAVAYLSFYVANDPAQGSGVISVVVFGLYGNWTSKWGMLARTEQSGAFDAVWDTITFAANGLVFFWSGIAAINYLINSVGILSDTTWSYAAIPLIYIFMLVIRASCLFLFNPIFAWAGERLSSADVVFTSWAGLRGAVSLIMVADFVSNSQFHLGDSSNPEDPYTQLNAVNADVSLWTAAFVLLTLCINAPTISPLMQLLRLNRIPWERRKMRARAKKALERFSLAAVQLLQQDEDEFLHGVNWTAVAQYVDVSQALSQFDVDLSREEEAQPPAPGSIFLRAWHALVDYLADGSARLLGRPRTRSRSEIPPVLSPRPDHLGPAHARMVKARRSAESARDEEEGGGGGRGSVAEGATSEEEPSSAQPSSVDLSLDDAAELAQELEGEIPFLHLRARASARATSAEDDLEAGGATAGKSWSGARGSRPITPRSSAGRNAPLLDLASELERLAQSSGSATSPLLRPVPGRAARAEEEAGKGSDAALDEDLKDSLATSRAASSALGRGLTPGADGGTDEVRGGGKATEVVRGGDGGTDGARGGAEAPAAADLAGYEEMSSAQVKALGASLRAALAAQKEDSSGASAERAGSDPASAEPDDELYYSSLPAHAGRSLASQFQLQRAALEQGSAPPPPTRATSTAGASEEAAPDSPPAAPDAAYYSSLPAHVGARLGAELARLRREQARGGALGGEAIPEEAEVEPEDLAGANARETAQVAFLTEHPEAMPEYYSSLPPIAGKALAAELAAQLAKVREAKEDVPARETAPAPPAGKTPSYYTSLPALAGRRLAQELAQELARTYAEPAKEEEEEQKGLEARSKDKGRKEDPEAGASTAPASSAPSDPSAPSTSSAPSSSATAPQASSLSFTASSKPAPRPSSQSQSSSSPPPRSASPERGEPSAASASTLPAAGGAALRDRLSRLLAQQAAADASAPRPAPSPFCSESPAGPSPPPRPPARPSYDASSSWATLSGATGRQLAAELRQSSLARAGPERRPVRPSAEEEGEGVAGAGNSQLWLGARSDVDLLGRRRKQQRAVSRFGIQAASDAGQPVPSQKSHQHPARHKAPLGPAATPFSNVLRRQRAESEVPVQLRSAASGPLPGRLRSVGSVPSSPRAAPLARPAANVVERVVAASWQNKVDRAALHKLPLRSELPMEALLRAGSGIERASSVGLARASTAPAPAEGEEAEATRTSGAPAPPSSMGSGWPEAATLLSEAEEDGEDDAPLTAEAQTEMRSRLALGLKRYFHLKRLQGLLSIHSLRMLDYACDHAQEHAHAPLAVWELLEGDVRGSLATRLVAQTIRRLAALYRVSPRWLQRAGARLFGWALGSLRGVLGRRMLVACEVAVEYYMALLWSPQTTWMRETAAASGLAEEVEAQVEAAYAFIINREIEAPDRFGAIQSYRAAMAVLRQQQTFVEELFDAGMLDRSEKEIFSDVLDAKQRHLEITGPVWRPPRPPEVLRALPFMGSLPDPYFKLLLKSGTIREYRTGEAFWASTRSVARSQRTRGPGAFVVLSGVVRQLHVRPDGGRREYFQGVGGVVGVSLLLTGCHLPGRQVAVAEGNALGKGPVLFHFPQTLAPALRAHVLQGLPGAAALEQDLFRLAASYAVQGMEREVTSLVADFLLRVAASRAEQVLRARASRRVRRRAGREAAEAPQGRLAPSSLLTPRRPPARAAAAAGAEPEAPASAAAAAGPGAARAQPVPATQPPFPAREEEGAERRATPPSPRGGELGALMARLAQEELARLQAEEEAVGAQGRRAPRWEREEGALAPAPRSEPLRAASAGSDGALSESRSAQPLLPSASEGESSDSSDEDAFAQGDRPDQDDPDEPLPEFAVPATPLRGRGARLLEVAPAGRRRESAAPRRALSVAAAGEASLLPRDAAMVRVRAQTAARAAPAAAAEVLDAVRRVVGRGSVLFLPAGTVLSQRVHWVLVGGGLYRVREEEGSKDGAGKEGEAGKDDSASTGQGELSPQRGGLRPSASFSREAPAPAEMGEPFASQHRGPPIASAPSFAVRPGRAVLGAARPASGPPALADLAREPSARDPLSAAAAPAARRTGALVLAPCPLPWLGAAELRFARAAPARFREPEKWVAARQGAILVACPRNAEGEVDPALRAFDLYGEGAAAAARCGPAFATGQAMGSFGGAGGGPAPDLAKPRTSSWIGA